MVRDHEHEFCGCPCHDHENTRLFSEYLEGMTTPFYKIDEMNNDWSIHNPYRNPDTETVWSMRHPGSDQDDSSDVDFIYMV